MAKVRVLRLISRLNVGGPAHHVLLLTRHLDSARFESLLVAGREPAGEWRAEAWIQEYGVEVCYLPALQRMPSIWSDLRAFIALLRLIKRYKPHILHTHTAKAGALGRLAGWLLGVPIQIHTYHGHSLRGYFSPLVSHVYQAIERFLARRTTKLIAISPELLEELVSVYRIAPREKFEMIRLGFPMERWAQYDERVVVKLRKAWAPQGEVLIGWVGRLVPIKRVERLISALKPLKEAGYLLKLVLVGEGPEKANLQALAQRLGVSEMGLWAGARWDMPNVYRAFDLVALPSANEGTPVVLIEALACGVPVIASAVGGIPDVLGQGAWGYLVPLEADWASALECFIKELPSWKQKAQLAQPEVLLRYDYRRLVAEMAVLYERCLAHLSGQ